MARGRIAGGAVSGGRRGGRRGRGRGRSPGAVANAQVGPEFDPSIRQTRSEAKGSRKRERDLGDWYNQLAADYQGAQDKGLAALRSVQDTTTQQLGEAASRSSADQAALAAQDQEFAKLTGGPTDSRGLSKIAEAGSAAERSRVALNLPVAQEQANFVGRLGSDRAAARLGGIEARRDEGRRREKIRADLAALQKDKANARTGKAEEIRTTRQQAQIERQEARTAEREAAADAAMAQIESQREARQQAVDNRQEEERIAISRRNAKTGERSQRATARSYEEDSKGGPTPAERRDRKEHAGDAMSAAKAQLGVKVPKSDKEWAQFEAALIEKLGTSYGAEAAAAVAKLRKIQGYKNRTRSRRMHQGKVPGH